jgi:glucose/arabinose dehydrogenase
MHRLTGSGLLLGALAACTSPRPVPEQSNVPAQQRPVAIRQEEKQHLPQAIAPKSFPAIPPPDAAAVDLPPGYRAEVVLADLTYPTSVEFDEGGFTYVAEAGYAYGDLVAPARVLRIAPSGEIVLFADGLSGPVTDLLWHEGRLLVSHRGRISAISPDGRLTDLVTDLPSFGDHHNNQLAAGPDGRIYFGQGTATNSGVVGLDNVYPYLWLAFQPDVFDIPAQGIELAGTRYVTPDALTVLAKQGELVRTGEAVQQLLSGDEPLLVATGAFQPFGHSAERVRGQVKANGTILRMNADGSGLEVYAWGLRNPFGVQWSPEGRLFASDNGYDERGSRPIANAPDCLWEIRQGAWYGFPDFAAGLPVTEPRFKSPRGKDLAMLLKTHPPVERPVLTRPPHVGTTKLEFVRGDRFGYAGRMLVPEFGGGTPVTAPEGPPVGHQLLAVDLATGDVQRIFGLKKGAVGPRGYEHVATPGPRSPIEARLSPDGDALYVVDFGGLAFFAAGAGPAARPFPGSGVLWRVTRDGTRAKGPPGNLTLLARAGAAPATPPPATPPPTPRRGR